ncbi:helix-turn-helix domain-containing protein [Pseudacidovorax sp. RU35E]|jgi:transcriptional regulator with XRE-family HTH domain|uniref:helix-turn-helix domain-containing protein n=1 Tax=Pseudacidovorax sp. RU35E TaxID=1907403 RepID=UPI000956669B|nr:helix-turn-helix transcriptional regulator [Pseudacidovorax sp. RU35E]SIR06060.1 Helix-turn-helix [Pseudacidovorax sp. RU35E]
MKNEFEAVGARIAEVRGSLTKQEFAQRIGVDRKTVERWEAGERLPDGSKLMKLLTEFDADLNYLLNGRPLGEAPALKEDERILLDNYRNSPPEAKAAIKAASDPFKASVTSKKKAA